MVDQHSVVRQHFGKVSDQASGRTVR